MKPFHKAKEWRICVGCGKDVYTCSSEICQVCTSKRSAARKRAKHKRLMRNLSLQMRSAIR